MKDKCLYKKVCTKFILHDINHFIFPSHCKIPIKLKGEAAT